MNLTEQPYADGAPAYLNCGVGMPIPVHGKFPPQTGLTGYNGTVTAAIVEQMRVTHADWNVGLRLDRTVVGIDVDDYDDKNGENDYRTWLQALGIPHRPTFSSTSRGPGQPSRIYYYRVNPDEATHFRGKLVAHRECDVEVIQYAHRYAMVWPTIHPDTKQPYRWYAPDGSPYDGIPDADMLPDLHPLAVDDLKNSGRTGTKPAAISVAVAEAALTGGPIDTAYWPIIAMIQATGTGRDQMRAATSALTEMSVLNQKPGGKMAAEVMLGTYLSSPADVWKKSRAEYEQDFRNLLHGSIELRLEQRQHRGSIFGTVDQPARDAAATAVQANLEADRADRLAAATTVDDDGQTAADQAVVDAIEKRDEAEKAFREAVAAERLRSRIRRTANSEDAAEEAGTLDFPRVIALDRFLAEPDQRQEWRVEGLLPTGGNVLLVAAQKSGKSTAAANLARALADGSDFLGRYPTSPAVVTMLDDESDEGQWRRRLRDQGLAHPENVTVVALRGKLNTFNILDPAVRARWVQLLRGTDVLVFDCVRPALDALGLDEKSEAGRFLVALDQLKAEAGVGEMVVVHHMGHDGERSRGDSRLLDWPDATWNIYLQKVDGGGALDHHQPREFDAYGRQVDVERVPLLFDPETQHLTVEGATAAQQRWTTCVADVLAQITGHPGVSQRNVITVQGGSGHTRDMVKRALDHLERHGRVEKLDGPRGAYTYHPAHPDPTAPYWTEQ